MTIRAILRDGCIQPIEPLPPEWVEGQELLVEQTAAEGAKEQVGQWAADLEAAAARLPVEDHDRFRRALDEIERESKDAVRQEWGLQ
jgi:hypothetical protein